MKKILHNISLHAVHSSGRIVGQYRNSRVYVDGGISGEIVNVELDRVQRGYRYGKVTEVVQTSPYRVQPFCKHYGICGGCMWQHIAYEEQLRLKREILQNALQKYEIDTPEIPQVKASPLQQGYRNKSEYTFAATSFDKHPFCLGFHVGEQRSQVCQIDECFLQSPIVQQIADTVQKLAIENNFSFYDYPLRNGLLKSLQLRTTTTGEMLLLLDCAEEDERIKSFLQKKISLFPVISSCFYSIDRGEPIHVFGETHLTERSGDLFFSYSPMSFYQPNPMQAEELCKIVTQYANLSGNELVYDLYTGIGSLAIHIANDAAAVIGIEGNAVAIADAQYNAKANGIKNTRFFVGDILHTFNDEFINSHGRPDVVILDPPRFGTLIEIKKTILRAAPKKIIYVSCNPVSLAFDLKQLSEKYNVTAIQPLDMFPHTHHVETVALLEKK